MGWIQTRHAGEVVSSRYRLLRQLGAGGMGEVWEAEHTSLGVSVALKFPRQGFNDDVQTQRFRRECRALAQVNSPYVVRVWDAAFDGPDPYLTMEFLDGATLAQRVPLGVRLAPPLVADILLQVAEGLAAIHSVGLIHRDVSPSNLFVLAAKNTAETTETSSARPYSMKVIDLGIARLEEGSDIATVTETIIGSPRYMSPEQARSEVLDSRTDCWALAAIAFRMLAGRDVFNGNCTTDILLEVCAASIPKVSQLVPTLSGDYDAFFDKALARNRDRRFQSVTELAAVFAALAKGGATWLGPNVNMTACTIDTEAEAKAVRHAIGRRYSLAALILGVGVAGVVGVVTQNLASKSERAERPVGLEMRFATSVVKEGTLSKQPTEPQLAMELPPPSETELKRADTGHASGSVEKSPRRRLPPAVASPSRMSHREREAKGASVHPIFGIAHEE